MRRVRRMGGALLVVGALVASTVGGIAVDPVSAAVTPQTGPAGAQAISAAFATSSANVTGASYESTTATGTPNGTSDSALAGFPTDGSTFGILTSGNVGSVPNSGTVASTGNGGAAIRGDTDRDVSILKTDISVPTGANCLTFDFKFLSEEYPRFIGGSFNDAFIAELDSSTWTTTGSAITAPNNFAFDGAGEVVSVNSTGIGGLIPAEGAGTAYDGGTESDGGATTLLHASSQITPGAHSLYFSIFDQGDTSLDSAVFLDNLTVGFVANPAVNCVSGATPVTATLDLTPATATNPTGTPHTVTALLENSDGAPIVGAPISFTVTGVNPGTGSGTTNADGAATFTYTGANAGTDQISACYNADSEGPCEAVASATKEWTPVEPTTHTLSVSVTGPGSVSSTPPGISCPEGCSADYSEGSIVNLSATPDESSTFDGWGGACEGTGGCAVTLGADTSVSAAFSAIPPPGDAFDVTNTSAPSTVTAGQTVQQAFTVTNISGVPQTGTSFVASFPAGATVVSSSTGQGSCTPTPATLTCSLGTLASGATVTITTVVRVPAGFPPGQFAPTATTDSTESDPGEFGELTGSAVVAPGGGQAFGFVAPGGTLTTGDASAAIPTTASFTLPNFGSGVPASLTTEPTTPSYCGGQACRGRLLTLSPFQGGYNDPNRPPVLDISLDWTQVKKYGPSWKVWVQKEDLNVAPKLVPDCKTIWTWEKYKKHGKWIYYKKYTQIASPSPCVSARYIDKNGDSHVKIFVLSGDPKFGRR